MMGKGSSHSPDHEFSDCLANLFDETSLDLLVNLLVDNYNKLKEKLKNTDNYLEKTKILGELQLTEAELIRFRSVKPFEPQIITSKENMSLDEFELH